MNSRKLRQDSVTYGNTNTPLSDTPPLSRWDSSLLMDGTEHSPLVFDLQYVLLQSQATSSWLAEKA